MQNLPNLPNLQNIQNLQNIVESNAINDKPTILTYTVPKNKNPFNGSYPVFFNNKYVASVEWSNNPSLNSTSLNNVIHGYLAPIQNTNSNYNNNTNIPDGLFIGTLWFKNKNKNIIYVSNSLTTIYGLFFIISIVINNTPSQYEVKIILTNNKKGTKVKNNKSNKNNKHNKSNKNNKSKKRK